MLVTGRKGKMTNLATFFTTVWVWTLVIFGVFIGYLILSSPTNTPDLIGILVMIDVIVGIVAFLLLIFFGFLALIFDKKPSTLVEVKQQLAVEAQEIGKAVKTSKIAGKFEDALSDVIFVPKKQGPYGFKHIFLGLLPIGFILFLIGNAISPQPPSPPPEPQNDYNPIQQITINEVDSKWVRNDLYVTGSVRNNNDRPVRNVQVRVDFFRDETNSTLFDTRFFTIPLLGPNSAYSFEQLMDVQHKNKRVWYNTAVVTASF